GRTGLLVPFGDSSAIAGALESLIADKDKRQAYGKAARAEALRRFSADAIIHRYEELYRRLINNPPSVPVGDVVEGCR
ncbi:MAG TPA: N-acetyl-alpha-D-glucosaminyl L-malate synthase BshA, partial [Candidatus Melainabacteria bacterium]|nr:N-acetyl-alpha-D-glucosaminyl L-malate synthase BshA [Candidatus Melainabacteria bacterium]